MTKGTSARAASCADKVQASDRVRALTVQVPVTVLRDGEALDMVVKLSEPTFLVPPHLSAGDPAYLVVSGLVFTVASEPYLESEYGLDYTSMAPVKLLEQVCESQAVLCQIYALRTLSSSINH